MKFKFKCDYQYSFAFFVNRVIIFFDYMYGIEYVYN